MRDERQVKAQKASEDKVNMTLDEAKAACLEGVPVRHKRHDVFFSKIAGLLYEPNDHGGFYCSCVCLDRASPISTSRCDPRDLEVVGA